MPTSLLALSTPELPTHLLCGVGPLTLGFEALAVREVMLMPLVTPLSQAAPLVAGALDLRGRVVPVLDLRAALELEITPPHAGDSLVILESGNRIAAVRVDEVRDVQLLAGAGRSNGESGNIAMGNGFVSSIARQTFGLVQLVDLEALFAAALAPSKPPSIEARAPGLTSNTTNWRTVWFAPAPGEREVLAARAQALARPLDDDGLMNGGASAQLMAAAMLGGELFGFDLKWVREFAPLPTLTRVPLGPPQVMGLLNLRGEILPLLDIRHALGMEATAAIEEGDVSARSHMEVVVVEHEGTRAAIWVEQVLDVFAAPGEIAALNTKHETAELLQGVVHYEDKNLAVLNLSRLMEELLLTN